MFKAKKRIVLDIPCLEWINSSLELTKMRVAALTPAIASESCKLPGEFHDDPADRMIVATARVERLQIITRNTRILDYSRHKYVAALKA